MYWSSRGIGLISLQGKMYSFSFWLKGEEDPNPAKAAQYRRWLELGRYNG
jgi:hypothetical protein